MSDKKDTREYATVEAAIKKFLYRSEDGSFVIVALTVANAPAGTPEMIAKGEMATAQLNVSYELKGYWEEHPRYGKQLRVTTFQTIYPTDLDGIKLYLRYNIKWIGPVISRKMIELYGADTLKILKEDPERVAREIEGVSLPRAVEVAEEMRANEKHEKLLVELETIFAGTKINRSIAGDVLKKWGEKAPKRIRENPYSLIKAFWGVGFLTADSVALRLGFAKDSPLRLSAGCRYTIEEGASDGHVCLPATEMKRRATTILKVDVKKIDTILETEIAEKRIILEGKNYYLPEMYVDETYISGAIRRLMLIPFEPVVPHMDELAPDQKRALETICSGAGVVIISGAPGTGKTFLLKRVISSFPERNILLVAPTGKAAKRMQEQTGLPASTIHRALEPIPESGLKLFARNEDNPLEASIIVVDESSMLDNWLTARLLEAASAEARFIFVGDTNQLPSVGAGNILKDMIGAGVPSIELDTIKRQDAGLIIRNCHAIKRGKDIETPMDADQDFMFIPRETPEKIQSAILTLLKRLPVTLMCDPLSDIQIITPRRVGVDLSCEKLNPILQKALGPEPFPGQKFREGDKVIQTVNDYNLGLVNGDIGRVLEIMKGEMWVRFENPVREVHMRTHMNGLDLAYAITCHKFQGSECRVIIIPVHKSSGAMVCQRNWLYTAISRAQKLCILVGQRAEISKMIWRQQQQVRYTRLKVLLMAKDGEQPLEEEIVAPKGESELRFD